MIKQIMVLLSAVLSLDRPASAQVLDDKYKESLARQFHYLLYVDIKRLPYFNYQNAILHPVDELSISFEETTASDEIRQLKSASGDKDRYEDFWYHDQEALGMERHTKSPLLAYQQGAICFVSKPQTPDQEEIAPNMKAAANCTIRLLVEAALAKSIIAAVIVPEKGLDGFIKELEKSRFNKLEGQTDVRTQMTLRILTYPNNSEHFLYRQI